MTKRTSQQKQPAKAEPVKSETSYKYQSPESKGDTITTEASPEQFKEILDIDDPNERSEALAEVALTEAQKGVAQDAAKEDFLGGDVQELGVEEVEAPNKRAQKLLDELESKGVAVSYPTDFSKWDASTYERLEKLNK